MSALKDLIYHQGIIVVCRVFAEDKKLHKFWEVLATVLGRERLLLHFRHWWLSNLNLTNVTGEREPNVT